MKKNACKPSWIRQQDDPHPLRRPTDVPGTAPQVPDLDVSFGRALATRWAKHRPCYHLGLVQSAGADLERDAAARELRLVVQEQVHGRTVKRPYPVVAQSLVEAEKRFVVLDELALLTRLIIDHQAVCIVDEQFSKMADFMTPCLQTD